MGVEQLPMLRVKSIVGKLDGIYECIRTWVLELPSATNETRVIVVNVNYTMRQNQLDIMDRQQKTVLTVDIATGG
jgi:hypothetical protein